ncbi:hypothetical protein F5X68DRAFT_276126 [Plectosphaerella plurivora]|uniref:Yeast cell wall synthesis Kre9/Knh1-like N-terminal domain-containing protein n=1 Tax=Plectosphaerella plurivora TaxID=936078 RepID=A0A9P9AAR1_9PEZI|nr:hypothetical protein F5X68DRAFT_276126 [Plectosphaerella plurivora]
MRATFILALIMGVAGLAAGLARSDDGFAPVMRPNENEAVDNGTIFEIEWQATASDDYESSQINLVLQAADDEMSRVTIADNVDYDQGAYNWTVVSPSTETRRFHIRIVLLQPTTSQDELYSLSPAFFVVDNATDTTSPEADSSSKTGLSKGEVAGIAAGCVVVVLVVLISWWLWRIDKRQKQRRQMMFRAARGSESGASGAVMVEAPSFGTGGSATSAELDNRVQPVELPAGDVDELRPRGDLGQVGPRGADVPR